MCWAVSSRPWLGGGGERFSRCRSALGSPAALDDLPDSASGNRATRRPNSRRQPSEAPTLTAVPRQAANDLAVALRPEPNPGVVTDEPVESGRTAEGEVEGAELEVVHVEAADVERGAFGAVEGLF